jgi:asparagine synthase (glutamine-hydrolysing)
MVDLSGGLTGWIQVHGFIILCMQQFMCADFLSTISDYEPYDDIGLNSSWLKGLSRFNREFEISQRVQLPGLLLSSKGDRVNMNSSVEARYPFLDSNLVNFASKLHEDYKLNGYVGKYLLRKVAEKWLPKTTAWRRKAMFRAPFESFSFSKPNGYVEFLLSKECIDKTMLIHESKLFKRIIDLLKFNS